MSHHRAPHKLLDDERPQQRQKAYGRPNRRSRFRNRMSFIPLGGLLEQTRLTQVLPDPHHDGPKPHPNRCGRHRQLRAS